MCAENYQKLYQSAFDADPGSLANIRAYPSNMNILVERIIFNLVIIFALQNICIVYKKCVV